MGLVERLRDGRAEAKRRRTEAGEWSTYEGACEMCGNPAQGAVNVATGTYQPSDFRLRCYDHGAINLSGCTNAAEHNAMGPILDALDEVNRLVRAEPWLAGAPREVYIAAALDRLDASQADVSGSIE